MGSECGLRLEILLAVVVLYGKWQQTEDNFILCFPGGTNRPPSVVAIGHQTEDPSFSLPQKVARPISGCYKRLKSPLEESETFQCG